jgi:hypothetical protein
LGQVLIFPYYSVRDGWQTLINVTNTSNRVVTAKVRFHEAYNSRDVFDFTLILSPYDVWTAVVEPMSAAQANDPADPSMRPSIRTTDNSCTVPTIPVLRGADAVGNGLPFHGVRGVVRTYAKASYTGPAADNGPATADRLNEGYVKVIMTGTSAPVGLAANAVHTPSGVPANCGALTAAFSNPAGISALRAAFPDYNQDINPLKGSYNLLKAESGMQISGTPTTLADFYRTALPPAPGNYEIDGVMAPGPAVADGRNYLMTLQLPPEKITPQVFSSSYHEPNLNAANTVDQVLLASGNVSTQSTGYPDVGADNVNRVLRRTNIVNQWANTTTTAWQVASDWVITHPTKRYYVDTATHQYAGRAAEFGGRPGLTSGSFPSPWFTNVWTGTSCEPVEFVVYDREEKTPSTPPGGPIFSPAPPDVPVGNAICREVNVLTFNGSNVLGSSEGITSNVPADAMPGGNGWMRLNFTGPGLARSVIGFSATVRDTGTDNRLNNAFVVDHAYVR